MSHKPALSFGGTLSKVLQKQLHVNDEAERVKSSTQMYVRVI